MPSPPAESETPAESSRGKVVIVDDEPDVLESTALLIESLGYAVVRLTDPAEILETVERERPGLLLQDLRMPDLNVAGLVATLRSNPATADVPLVFYSASSDLSTTAARYDAWGYLPKPFSKEEVASLLERIVGPPPRRPHRYTPRDVQREIKTVFHDQWNLLSALNTYLQVLDDQELDDDAIRAVHGLQETLVRLESKTDRLRTYILTLLESTTEYASEANREPVDEPRRREKERRAGRSADSRTSGGRR